MRYIVFMLTYLATGFGLLGLEIFQHTTAGILSAFALSLLIACAPLLLFLTLLCAAKKIDFYAAAWMARSLS